MAIVWKEIGGGKFILEEVTTSVNHSGNRYMGVSSMTFKNNDATEIEITVSAGSDVGSITIGSVTGDGTYTQIVKISQTSSQKQETVSLLDSTGKPYPYIKITNQITSQTVPKNMTLGIKQE